MAEGISIVWEKGRASVQLTLGGKWRAIDANGVPCLFDTSEAAIAYAATKGKNQR